MPLHLSSHFFHAIHQRDKCWSLPVTGCIFVVLHLSLPFLWFSFNYGSNTSTLPSSASCTLSLVGSATIPLCGLNMSLFLFCPSATSMLAIYRNIWLVCHRQNKINLIPWAFCTQNKLQSIDSFSASSRKHHMTILFLLGWFLRSSIFVLKFGQLPAQRFLCDVAFNLMMTCSSKDHSSASNL